MLAQNSSHQNQWNNLSQAVVLITMVKYLPIQYLMTGQRFVYILPKNVTSLILLDVFSICYIFLGLRVLQPNEKKLHFPQIML